MQETWVWSLGWEDPLKKGMATHSSILAWRILWTEEPGGLQFIESQIYLMNYIQALHWEMIHYESSFPLSLIFFLLFIVLCFLQSQLFWNVYSIDPDQTDLDLNFGSSRAHAFEKDSGCWWMNFSQPMQKSWQLGSTCSKMYFYSVRLCQR